jgi:hypothetical protein
MRACCSLRLVSHSDEPAVAVFVRMGGVPLLSTLISEHVRDCNVVATTASLLRTLGSRG